MEENKGTTQTKDKNSGRRLGAVGLLGTVIWVAAVLLFISWRGAWDKFLTLDLNLVGDFVAGVTAPLAFWWLVLGYFQQGIELRQNVEALERQSEETANLVSQAQVQAEAIKANELHARRDTFFRLAELLLNEQSTILNSLIALCVGHQESDVWEEYSKGNIKHFHHKFYAILDGYERHIAPKFEGNAFAKGQFMTDINHYIENYEQLTKKAAECDPDKSILSIYELGIEGRIYIKLCDITGREPIFYLSRGASFMTPLGRV